MKGWTLFIMVVACLFLCYFVLNGNLYNLCVVRLNSDILFFGSGILIIAFDLFTCYMIYRKIFKDS